MKIDVRLWLRRISLPLMLLLYASALRAAEPFFSSELLFPRETRHNHASSIAELPSGKLLAARSRGANAWSPLDTAS